MNRLAYLAHHGEPEQIIKEVMEALEEKDARIAELLAWRDLVQNKAYAAIQKLQSQYIFCDCSDDPQDDFCMNCTLQNIMLDIERGEEST